MRRPVADCLVLVMKRSNVRGAKGAGHPRRVGQRETGGTRYTLGGHPKPASRGHLKTGHRSVAT